MSSQTDSVTSPDSIPSCESNVSTYRGCSTDTRWRLDCCHPHVLPPPVENLESYMTFQRDAIHDVYECSSDCRPCPVGNAHFITNVPTDMVVKQAATDAGGILELAIRSATGCAAPFEPRNALMFTDIVLMRHDYAKQRKPLQMTVKLHAQAHAIAALVYLLIYRRKDSVDTLAAYMEDSDLHHAACDANAAVNHGHRFPGAFDIAEVVLELAVTHGRDPRQCARFGEFKALWKAYDLRQRVLEKVSLAPARYTCAYSLCAFRTMKAKQLRRCTGTCAGEDEASYCSRTCQKNDWQRHKTVCSHR